MRHEITRLIALSVVLTCLSFAAWAQGKPAPKRCRSVFRVPQDGATIKGGFWCRFGLRNMGVTHAGDDFQNSGHHHLLIDVTEPLDPNEPISQDQVASSFWRGPNRGAYRTATRKTYASACARRLPSIIRSTRRWFRIKSRSGSSRIGLARSFVFLRIGTDLSRLARVRLHQPPHRKFDPALSLPRAAQQPQMSD